MKKIFFLAAAASVMITQTGCFGSFALVKKIYEFNQGVSDNKVVQTLMFYLMNIIPVYGIGSFIDVVVLNLIEFWSGSNPLSLNEGEMEEQLLTIKGESYKVIATKNKFSFEKIVDGNAVDMGELTFSTEEMSWNFEKEGISQKLVQLNEDGSADFSTLAGFQTFDVSNLNALTASNSKAVLQY